MMRVMSAALLILSVLAVLLLVIWSAQRRLMYFPDRNVPPPDEVALADAEPVRFTTDDGLTLHGWFVRSPGAAWTVIVFNGNGGNRAYRAPLAAALRADGMSVLLFDYRGYGENAGSPTESGLAGDARAARAYAATRPDVDPRRLVYLGESLGSAVAIRLAAEQPPAALILRSPFASMVEVGRIHYPWLPVGLLLRDRFASIEQVSRVRCPVLVLAGDRDGIVPLEQSRRLYDALPGTKSLVIVRGADHNDEALLSGRQMLEAIARFLSGIP